MSPSDRKAEVWTRILIFVVVVVTHLQSGVQTPFDSGWSIQVTSSILREGNIDLDEFREHARATVKDQRIVEHEGHLLPRYPIAPSVLVVPLYAMTKSVVKRVMGISLERHYLLGGNTKGMEHWLSSLLVGLAALLIYQLARRELGRGGALLITVAFAFGTSAWSVVSRALWQHSPSMVFVTLALLALTREGRRAAFWGGVAVGLAYTMRPTHALLVVFLVAYLAWKERERLPAFLGGGVLVAIPFLVHNMMVWGQPLTAYYLPGKGNAFKLEGFADGLAGTLISPGRGLFLYSPFLLFALLGLVLRLKEPKHRALAGVLALIIVLHWLMISSWFSWWGGMVYGPRLFADLLPIFMFFLIPVVAAFERRRRWHQAWAAVFLVTLTWSIWVHREGATRYAVWDWNVLPKSVDKHPERLWEWHDPPFLRTDEEVHPIRQRTPEPADTPG
ncbi:MAG: glycosyltransferase family 39 protein [Holophagales bacterium]|nr:glycosyltransferase family 39 protein [Holophagales bacterium]